MAQIRYVFSSNGEGLAREVAKIIGKYEAAQVSVQALESKVRDERNPDRQRTLYEAFVVHPST